MDPLKPPLTYKQQIQRLKKIHNLSIPNEKEAIRILSVANYYRLSGYGIGLKKNKEEYYDGISINTLYRLYLFDSRLRKSLMFILEHIEVQLRTQIAYELSLAYGSECYTDPSFFVTKTKSDGTDIHTMIIQNFQKECDRQKNIPFVQHHMTKYGGHFPIWVAVELFTFGNLSSLYGIMKDNDRVKIAQNYEIAPKHLHSWILTLVEVRNLCAHYERIYNMPLQQTPFLFSEYRKYRKPKNKLFPVLLAIKGMMKGSAVYSGFLDELKTLMSDFSDVVDLSFIGFPLNWYNVLSKSDKPKKAIQRKKKQRK